MTTFKTIAAIACLLVGGLWFLQGIGLVGGSFMTGNREWLIIGTIVALFGVGLLVQTEMARRRRR